MCRELEVEADSVKVVPLHVGDGAGDEGSTGGFIGQHLGQLQGATRVPPHSYQRLQAREGELQGVNPLVPVHQGGGG